MRRNSVRTSSRRLGAVIVGLTMCILSSTVCANSNPDDPSRLEALQLPAYCHKQYGIPSNTPMPTEVCGHLMNHFCPALVFLNRASDLTAPKWKRRGNARRARSGLEYSKKGMPANCKLAGEVNTADVRLRVIETYVK